MVSVKRLTWQLEVLERGMQNLLDGQLPAARTRLDLGIKMAKCMLKQAEKYKAKAMEARK